MKSEVFHPEDVAKRNRAGNVLVDIEQLGDLDFKVSVSNMREIHIISMAKTEEGEQYRPYKTEIELAHKIITDFFPPDTMLAIEQYLGPETETDGYVQKSKISMLKIPGFYDLRVNFDFGEKFALSNEPALLVFTAQVAGA